MQYHIMHRNDVIAKADENQITEILNRDLCPACFAVGMPLTRWLDDRTVDVHRSHSRRLFKALRLKSYADTDQMIEVGHGITVTDNWWIQKADENLDYYSLKKYNEELADIAFYGSSDSHKGDISGYRELGTVGSFEKAWRFVDNAWYMFKQGSTPELLSEYYACVFLKAMGVPVADYSIQKSISQATGLESVCIITKDFTDNAEMDFEPFCNYYSDNEEPEYILPRLNEEQLCPYVMMLFYDALLHNGDRHNQNVGFLRDSTTGEITGLAPYFDYNMCLIAYGIPRIDMERGNLFTEEILNQKLCCRVLNESFPDRNQLVNAVMCASEETRQAFELPDFNYSLLEDYIIDTYDYFDSQKERIKQKAEQISFNGKNY